MNRSDTDILQLIDKLRDINALKMDIDLIKNQLLELLKSYANTARSIPASVRFHRAIKYSQKPQYVHELGYPPINRTDVGRANVEFKPVFYCSGDPKTTFFETALQPGNMVVLSKWTVLDEIFIFPIGYTQKALIKLGSSRNCPEVIPLNKRHPAEFNQINLSISDSLHEIFTDKVSSENKSLYSITASISEHFLSLRANCGIAYPSIAMKGNAENFVFTTELVDKYLKIHNAYWIKIDKVEPILINKRVEDTSYTVSILSYADSFQNGKIEWRTPTPDEANFLYR